MLFTLLIGRVLIIDNRSDYVTAAQGHSTYTLRLAQTRGKIYDRNGSVLAGDCYAYKAVVIPSPDTAASLLRVLSADETQSVESLQKTGDRLKGNFPFAVEVPDGSCESEGITVYRVPKRYSDSALALHLVGSCTENGGQNGIEKAYDQWLSDASGELTVTCRINAAGKSLDGTRQEVTDTTANSDRGVMLTIDSRIQNIAETAAARHITSGAVIVADVDSGEIVAMVSLPAYRRSDVAAVLHDESAPLINRALLAYNAGSVFKPVVAAAALEHGLDPEELYECEGTVRAGSLTMGCINHTAHGSVNLNDAIAHSCNTYFIHTAQRIGGGAILDMAQNLGFGSATQLASRYAASAGTLPAPSSLSLPAALANFSFGQGTLTVTPVQVTGMMLAIARGGEYIEPTVIKGLTDGHGHMLSPPVQQETRRAMSRQTAERIGDCLRSAVLEGTAKAGASEKITSAAKTGTAETGIIRNGKAINQAWYAGYFPYEDPRYVCVVLAEGGTSGGGSAGPVFQEIANRMSVLL